MNRQLTATYVLLAALAVTSSVSGQVPGPMPPTAVAPNLAAQAMGSFAGPAIGAVQPALYSARPGQRGAVQQVTFPPAAFPGGQRGPFAPGPFPPGAVQPAAFQADCPDCGPPSGSGSISAVG